MGSTSVEDFKFLSDGHTRNIMSTGKLFGSYLLSKLTNIRGIFLKQLLLSSCLKREDILK